MGFSFDVRVEGAHPGPIGPRALQNPHDLLPDAPALYPDLRSGSEAKLLAEGGWKGGLALGGNGDDVHAQRVSPIALLGKVSGKVRGKEFLGTRGRRAAPSAG